MILSFKNKKMIFKCKSSKKILMKKKRGEEKMLRIKKEKKFKQLKN